MTSPAHNVPPPPPFHSPQAAQSLDVVGGAYAAALVDAAKAANSLDAVHADVDALQVGGSGEGRERERGAGEGKPGAAHERRRFVPSPSPTHLNHQTLFKDSPDVKEFLCNPVVPVAKKREALARVGREAGLTKSTVNFLNILVDNDRMVAADSVFASFEKLYCGLTDTQVATVRSAVKLEQEQQFLVAKKLQELTGAKNVKLKPEVDPSLIAGFVVEYGSSQVDLSVKGQLDKITAELTSSQV